MDTEKTTALQKKFWTYRKENPLEFTQDQLNKIELDIIKPRNGVVCDEYVEFILWTKGLKSRQEYFADYVELLFPSVKYQKLLEVGCGRTARLSKLLTQKGYEMTAMDPQIAAEQAKNCGITCIKDTFLHGQTDITAFDMVIAQEPCEATEHIIRECVAQKKDYFISLCGVAHPLLNGKTPEDVYAWYDYLEEIGGEKCALVDLKMIPGYSSYVIMACHSAQNPVDL